VPEVKRPLAKGDYPEWCKSAPPKTLNKNRTIDGVLHFSGVGDVSSDVLFVGPCVLDEEANDRTSPARLLKGPASNLFLRNLQRSGFDPKQIYYTTLCKYTLARGRKMRPKLEDLRWCHKLIENDLEAVTPKVIVCLGKQVFDYFVDFRATFRDVHGGFFHSSYYDCLVYVMDQITTPFYKPEYISRSVTDLKAVKKYVDDMNGVGVGRVATDYTIVRDKDGLDQLMSNIRAIAPFILSVDCEWSGMTHVDGKLRSIQLCWAPGKAVYIMFRDQDGLWVWDEPEAVIYKAIGTFLSEGYKFIAHNACADFLWMESHLGVDTHNKCAFDTMFAEFLIDEYSDIKLERLSLKYTDLGRYDTELFLAKKKLGIKKEEGYARIPDDIIVPYACKDTDVVMRAYPILLQKIYADNLHEYYFDIYLPYVTNAFRTMSDTGVPINKAYLDVMRDVFTNNEALLILELRLSIKQEATLILAQKLYEKFGESGSIVFRKLVELDEARVALDSEKWKFPKLDLDFVPWDTDLFDSSDIVKRYADPIGLDDNVSSARKSEIGELLADIRQQSLTEIKSLLSPDDYSEYIPLFEHWWEAHTFNIRSDSHKRRWLFSVRNFEPVKTTKKDGIQMPWEAVLKLDKSRQLDFSPSTDKETIKIFSERCPLVARVLELNSVGNIVKMFLKGPNADGTEQGLHKWIQTDGRLHCNFASTETGRPRTWNPNVLNYPKAITRPIEAAFKRLGQDKPYSLRSCVEAPEGWCLVDADLETAEVLGLAYISGDEEMINVCLSGDEDFVKVCPKLADEHNISWLRFKGMDVARVSNVVDHPEVRVLDPITHNVIHPLRDMHWEMAETMTNKSREFLDADIDRLSGKVGMFSIPYGASPKLLERTIESITGIKPDPETGDKLIDAYEVKFPVAAAFLRSQEACVETPGFYRSISGRVRHFHVHGLGVEGLSENARKSLMAPLTREARNYPMQEIVAATMARAVNMIIQEFRDNGMRARPMILLHDALTILSPLSERWKVKELLQKCMSDCTTWEVNGRTLQFAIDVDFSYRWGMKPNKEDSEYLNTK